MDSAGHIYIYMYAQECVCVCVRKMIIIEEEELMNLRRNRGNVRGVMWGTKKGGNYVNTVSFYEILKN